MAVASKGYFAMSKETTPGTAITTPTKYYPVEEVDFSWENEFTDLVEIGGSRQRYSYLDSRIAPTATLKGAVYPQGAMGLIFYGLMGGKSAATVLGAQEHTFSDAATLPYFTLERSDARSGEGGILCERLSGCKVESVSLSAAFGEKVDLEASFQAMKKPVTATAVAAGSITYPTAAPIVFKGASITIDAVASNFFKSINIELRNTLARQEALNATQESYKIFEGGQECTISATMVFEDLTIYNKLVNATEMALVTNFASTTAAGTTVCGVSFTWDKVRVARYSVPFRAGEVIEADVDFKVQWNQTNSRATLLKMVNMENTTVYDT